MRPASFYVGVVILGTVAPLALASWTTIVTDVRRTSFESVAVLGPTLRRVVPVPDLRRADRRTSSRRSTAGSIATSLLGARLVGRPITVRQAVARARTIFWRALAATLIVGIPLHRSRRGSRAWIGASTDFSADAAVLVTLGVTALIGAPFAYLLTGIVLGDVGAIEAIRRSLRVFRARKLAAVVVALFETVAQLLVLFGLSAGLDIAIRVPTRLVSAPSPGRSARPDHDRHPDRGLRGRDADLHRQRHLDRAAGRDVRRAHPRDVRA